MKIFDFYIGAVAPRVGFADGSDFVTMVVAFGDEGRHRRCRGLSGWGNVMERFKYVGGLC